MRMSRLLSRLGRRWLPMRDHQYEVWSAVPPHLTHMGTKHGEALDRTPMWTLDELCTVFRTTSATVHTWRKHRAWTACLQVGRHLLFADADVREWLEACAADAERDVAGPRTSRQSTGSGWWPVGKVRLKPGQHGQIFVNQRGPKSWRGEDASATAGWFRDVGDSHRDIGGLWSPAWRAMARWR
jgi:hypothetical protein